MTVDVIRTSPELEGAVVAMLAEHWREQGWCQGKYDHYYKDYPEGEPISLVALDAADGTLLGHFGLLPVQVDEWPAFLALQVLVNPAHRRGDVFAALVAGAEKAARERGAAFICGFPNRKFATVVARLFGWTIVGYQSFVDVEAFDPRPYRDRNRFKYSPAWYEWKFGHREPPFTQRYTRDGQELVQVLKAVENSVTSAHELGCATVNVWHPDHCSAQPSADWSQAFVWRAIAPGLPAGLTDITRWLLEMGDSDTFEPLKKWSESRA